MILPRPLARRLPRRLREFADWCIAGRPPVAPPAASQPIELQRLLARHHGEVVDRLARIHATPYMETDQDRFLILSLLERLECYVQCAFGVRDRWMLCEVASGVFFDEPRTMFLAAPQIAALGRLGFETDDRIDNFRQAFRLAAPPDLAAVASLMLAGLYTAFDARAEDEIDFVAQYAMER